MATISETAASIVALLGGPDLNSRDIDCSDNPAGKRLLEWFVSQVQLDVLEAEEDVDATDTLNAAIQAISLREDELQTWRRVSRPANVTVPGEPKTQYILPWRLRAKDQSVVAEASLLESNTDVLKARLQQSKVASQTLAKTIKVIASEIEQLDNEIVASEERLSELSLNADSSIQVSIKSGLDLLQDCAGSHNLDQYESLLAALSSTRTAITGRFDSQLRAIDSALLRLPTPEELHTECHRLNTAMNAPRADADGRGLVATALVREMAQLCAESENDPELLSALLASRESKQSIRAASNSVGVSAQVEAAWSQDQAAILDARGATLDEAIRAFGETLLPQLTLLQADLSVRNAHLREAEAIVGALREELHNIVEDVQRIEGMDDKTGSTSDDGTADAELRVGLVSLFKRLKDFRPQDAPPLVLLNQEDALAELRTVYERRDASQCQEEWAANLLPKLLDLEAAHAPILDAIYAESSLNTSPPFVSPPDVLAVRADAKCKADELEGAIFALQEEMKVLTNDRVKKRMDHFVGKWAISK